MSVYYMCAGVYRPEEGFGFFEAGNQTHILCKGSQCAEVLSPLFSGLHFFCLESHVPQASFKLAG